MTGILPPRVLAVLFWEEVLCQWYRLYRAHVGEIEVLGEFRLAAGVAGNILFHLAWAREEPSEDDDQGDDDGHGDGADGENGEEEEDPNADDPEVVEEYPTGKI